MENTKEAKLQLLDTLLTEKEALTAQVNTLEREINRLWIDFCGEFYEEGVGFEGRVTNMKNYIAEKKPGLSERMMGHLKKSGVQGYLQTLSEERSVR